MVFPLTPRAAQRLRRLRQCLLSGTSVTRVLTPFTGMRRCVLSLLLPLLAVPSARGEDTSTVNVELPCGASISIPSDWYPPKREVTLANLKASGKELFKPTGTTHFHANSNPRFTYAAVNVGLASDGPGEEAVQNITPKELADYTREKKSDLEAQYAKKGKSSLVSFGNYSGPNGLKIKFC